MDIRLLRPSDIPHVQLANITNLPENYFCKYYLYHAMSWPQLSYVAVDVSCFSLRSEADVRCTSARDESCGGRKGGGRESPTFEELCALKQLWTGAERVRE
jgi:ribosomal protein S18 acetylase RimI-like enzyme